MAKAVNECSSGHLSFDGYEQDQTMSLDANQDGDERDTSYQINDNIGDTPFIPEFISTITALRAIPDGPEKQKAIADFRAKHPYTLRQRAALGSRTGQVSRLFAYGIPKATLASSSASPPPPHLACSSSIRRAKSLINGQKTQLQHNRSNSIKAAQLTSYDRAGSRSTHSLMSWNRFGLFGGVQKKSQ